MTQEDTMNTTLIELRAFLEDAHKNGTDCSKAERNLTRAKNALRFINNTKEKDELKNIITELEQIHNVCFVNQREEDDFECDDPECGV